MSIKTNLNRVKEDDITNLIVWLFDNSNKFRISLLKGLGENPEGWSYLARASVKITKTNARMKDVPDLIFYNDHSRRIIIIENKLYAGEAYQQTLRYSSPEFVKAIQTRLEFEAENIAFYYLTLDKDTPVSPVFKSLSYYDLLESFEAACQDEIDDISKIAKIYYDGFVKYYKRKPPRDSSIVIYHLLRKSGLVRYFKNFKLISYEIFKDFGMNIHYGKQTVDLKGFIAFPMCQVYKTNWKGQWYEPGSDGQACFQIYLEFRIDVRYNYQNVVLAVNYTTFPYIPGKAVKEETSETFYNDYSRAREKFYDYIKNNSQDYWVKRKTGKMIAKYKFKNKIKFGELKEEMFILVNEMTELIDKYIEDKEK